MRRLLLPLVAATSCAAAAAAAPAAVVSTEPGALVRCAGESAAPVTADAHGKAALPKDCRPLTCENGDRAGLVVKNACRLAPAALVTLGPLPPGCSPPDGCVATLTKGEAPVAASRVVAGTTRWRLPALPAGAYRLTVRRAADGWSCARDVTLAAGRAQVETQWTEPRPLHGRVLGPDLAPRAGVDVRLEPEAGSEVWTCTPAAMVVPSDGDGRFRLLVDPRHALVVKAGGASVAPEDAGEFVTLILP